MLFLGTLHSYRLAEGCAHVHVLCRVAQSCWMASTCGICSRARSEEPSRWCPRCSHLLTHDFHKTCSLCLFKACWQQ